MLKLKPKLYKKGEKTLRIFILLLFILSTTAFSKSVKNENVVDLLYSANNQLRILTIDSDPGAALTKDQLDNCLKIKDIKNGFLEVACKQLTVTYQVAKFTKKQKGFVLVIVEDGISVQRRWFLEKFDGIWIVDNNNIFPKITQSYLEQKYNIAFPKKKDWGHFLSKTVHSRYRLKLPQNGTHLSINSGLNSSDYSDKLLFKMKWDKEHFFLP